MSHVAHIRVGVVVARERIAQPWEEFAWRPVEVVFPAPAEDRCVLMRKTEHATYYFLGTTDIELHRKETTGYLENLSSDAPSLYVVARRTPETEPPLQLHLVTASPTEGQAYAEGGDDILEPVAMPAGIAELVAMFAAEHHVEEKFIKRVRQKFGKRDEHQFGQEPIAELRTRMRRAGNEGGHEPVR
jgi:hypothetical protein